MEVRASSIDEVIDRVIRWFHGRVTCKVLGHDKGEVFDGAGCVIAEEWWCYRCWDNNFE